MIYHVHIGLGLDAHQRHHHPTETRPDRLLVLPPLPLLRSFTLGICLDFWWVRVDQEARFWSHLVKNNLAVPSLEELTLHFCLGKERRVYGDPIPPYLRNLDWELLDRGAKSRDALPPLRSVHLAAFTKLGEFHRCPDSCFRSPLATDQHGVIESLLSPYVQDILVIDESDEVASRYTRVW